jgi:hypothetical protein
MGRLEILTEEVKEGELVGVTLEVAVGVTEAVLEYEIEGVLD